MRGNLLFIFVEGSRDRDFVESTLCNELSRLQIFSKIICYADKDKDYIKNYISSINSIPYADYLFVKDMDESTDKEKKKKSIIRKISLIDQDKIILVIREIESWYLAGLTYEKSNELGFEKYPKDTETINKEKFLSSNKKYKNDLIDLYLLILKYFDRSLAEKRNLSYKYFTSYINERFLQVVNEAASN